MRQEYIEVFLEIVKTRNLSKTAENLHMSQSTVSQALKMLEHELAVPLILRHKGQRTTELTGYGEEFIPIAESWMSLSQQIDNLKHFTSPEITIGAVDNLNANVLYPTCQKISSELPTININIKTAQSVQLYQMTEKREIDLGLVSGEANLPYVLLHPLFEQQMCVIRNYKNSTPNQICHPSDLQVKDEIMLDWGPQHREWHEKWWSPHAHPHIRIESIVLLHRFMEIPGCWAVLPRIDVPDTLEYPIEICDFGDNNPPNRMIYQIEPRYMRPNRRNAIYQFHNELKAYVDNQSSLLWCYK